MSRYAKKLYLDMELDELLKLSRAEVSYDLSEKEMLFCEYYVENKNLKISAIKAGYSERGAHSQAYRIRNRPRCKRYIAWLKYKAADVLEFRIADLIELYMRIVFADMNDFIDMSTGKPKIKDKKFLDGQLISEVRHGKDGFTIKLVDKLAAADKLERFFDIMPKEWKEKIEEKKLELMKEKLSFEKEKWNGGSEDMQDDGFIDAIQRSAKVIWGKSSRLEDFHKPEQEDNWKKMDLDTEDEEEVDWDSV